MRMSLLVTLYEHGKFPKDGKEWNYARLAGYDQNGRWARMVGYGEVAAALIKQMDELVGPSGDVSERRFIVETEGEWLERPRLDKDKNPILNDKGQPLKDRSFRIGKFTFLAGPSLERARARLDATQVLNNAYDVFKDGDAARAYKVLEAFVASIARQPAPSVAVDDEHEASGPAETIRGPEEKAAEAFARRDARSSSPAETAVAGVAREEAPTSVAAAEAEANRPAEAETAQAEPASQADKALDAPSEPTEEAAATPEPAPAAEASKPMPPRPMARPGLRPPLRAPSPRGM